MTERRNAAARPDRLPTSAFHRRILLLIAMGLFFDGFGVYLAATVLGATLKSGFSTLNQNAQFVSITFSGMMLGAFLTGFLGDCYGRRFTYQANLAIFGLASIGAAFAPSMSSLLTIVTPFAAVALYRSYGVGGVLSLMVGLLVVQIFVVLFFGLEPKRRSLEEIAGEVSPSCRVATM